MTKLLVEQLNLLELAIDSLMTDVQQVTRMILQGDTLYNTAHCGFLDDGEEYRHVFPTLVGEFYDHMRSLNDGIKNAEDISRTVSDWIRNGVKVTFPCVAPSQSEAAIAFASEFSGPAPPIGVNAPILQENIDHKHHWLYQFAMWGRALRKKWGWNEFPHKFFNQVTTRYKIELTEARKKLATAKNVIPLTGSGEPCYLDIILDEDKFMIRRGTRNPQSLTKLTLTLCRFLLRCGLDGATTDEVDNALMSAGFERSARKQTIKTLKECLEALDLSIPPANKSRRYIIVDVGKQKLTSK